MDPTNTTSKYRVEFIIQGEPPIALEDAIANVCKEYDIPTSEYRYVRLVDPPEREIVFSAEGIPLHMLDNIQIQEL